ALVSIGSDSVPALIEFLGDNKKIEIQKCAVAALVKIGAPAKTAVPPLKKLLQHEDLQLCCSAASALWQIDKNTEGVPALVAMLKKSTDGKLAQTKQPIPASACPELRSYPAFSTSPSGFYTEERRSQDMANALGELGSGAKAALPELERTLFHKDSDVRSA